MRSPTLMLMAVAFLFAVPVYHLPKTFSQPANLPAVTKPDPLPASARPTVERCEKTMADAKKVYETACAKARAQAIKDLEPAMKTETQKGNLDGAMAIKAKVEEYKKDQTDTTPNIKPPIVGSWVWIHGRTAVFKTDGTATQSDGLTKSLLHTGKWKEVKGVVEVEWDGTEIPIYYETVTLNGDVGKVFNKNFTLRFDIKKLGD